MGELLKRKGVKVSVLVICVLVVCVIAGITAKSINRQKAITAHMEIAQKYLSELDYEQAIAEYMAALSIEPNNQEVLDALEQLYLDMAQVRIDVEAYSEAINILDRGYDELQRKTLLEKKDEVEELQAQKEEEERLAEEARLKEEKKKAEEEARKAKEKGASIIDLKDYPNILPEDLGGNLAETLADAIYPNNPSISYDDSGFFWVIGNGSIEIGASMNNDGFFVFVYDYVENFSVYGLQVGMTEKQAIQILSEQGIIGDEMQQYFITDNIYITLEVTNGILDRITYACHLR